MPTLRIHLLGQPSVYIDEWPVKFHGARALAVLLYCVACGRPVPDDDLLALLWPHESQGAAKKLTEAISQINSRIGHALRGVGVSNPPKACIRDRGSVAFRWNPADLDYDVAKFEELAKTTINADIAHLDIYALEQAYALYNRGLFLGTFNLDGVGASFDDWINFKRDALEILYRSLLQPLIVHQIAHSAWATAITCLQQLQQSAPEGEISYGLLMLCYAVTGDTVQAEETYRQYLQMMDTTLHTPPSDALTKLYHAIRSGHLEQMTIRDIIDRIKIKWHSGNAPLQSALQEVFNATGVKSAPMPSLAYHRVLQRAQEEAISQGSNFVGTPHLFLALCAIDGDIMQEILQRMGIALEDVVQSLRDVLGTALAYDQGQRAQTLVLQRILRVAHDLASKIEADAIESGHLWIALLSEEHNLLDQVLARYAVERLRVLSEVQQTIE